MDRLTFHDRCAAHDWFWRFADDSSQPHIQAAKQEESDLRGLAQRDPILALEWALWTRWADARVAGKPAVRPSRYDAQQMPGQMRLAGI